MLPLFTLITDTHQQSHLAISVPYQQQTTSTVTPGHHCPNNTNNKPHQQSHLAITVPTTPTTNHINSHTWPSVSHTNNTNNKPHQQSHLAINVLYQQQTTSTVTPGHQCPIPTTNHINSHTWPSMSYTNNKPHQQSHLAINVLYQQQTTSTVTPGHQCPIPTTNHINSHTWPSMSHTNNKPHQESHLAISVPYQQHQQQTTSTVTPGHHCPIPTTNHINSHTWPSLSYTNNTNNKPHQQSHLAISVLYQQHQQHTTSTVTPGHQCPIPTTSTTNTTVTPGHQCPIPTTPTTNHINSNNNIHPNTNTS